MPDSFSLLGLDGRGHILTEIDCMALAIGIDLGGTDIKAGVVSDTGDVVYRTKVPTAGHEGGPAVIQRMSDLVGQILAAPELASRRSEIEGVGVGSPGLIDQKAGTITCPVNIPDWEDAAPIKTRFEATHGIRAEVDNDANVCALGEALFGAGRGRSVVIAMTLGTGIGGGIVINGRVYTGAHGYAGEVGHATVNPEGLVCACGNVGCMEAYASATGIARYARDMVGSNRQHGSLLEKWAAEGKELSSKLVYEAALQDDKLAHKIIAWAGRWLGIGLGSLMVAFDPEIIVIGGGASAMGDLLFDHIRTEINERVYFTDYQDVPIVRAELGEDAGFIGAAGLTLQG